MSAALRLALAGLAPRARAARCVRIVVLAAAVALLGSMLLFIGHSLRTMTGSAVRSVPLDWQGPVAPTRRRGRSPPASHAQPGIQQASADRDRAVRRRLAHRRRRARPNAGSGSLLAVPPGYLAHIHTFRFLHGSLRPGAIVLDQQLAATLQAQHRRHGHAHAAARGAAAAASRSPASR